MKNVVHAGTVGGKDTESKVNDLTNTSTVVQGSSERGEQEKRSDHLTRSDRKKTKKRQRLEDQEEEEHGFF